MTNEEFQKIVLEKLENIGKEQQEMKKYIKIIIEQTAELSEFRYETNQKIDKLTEEFNTIEIVTSKNWSDIAKLKASR